MRDLEPQICNNRGSCLFKRARALRSGPGGRVRLAAVHLRHGQRARPGVRGRARRQLPRPGRAGQRLRLRRWNVRATGPYSLWLMSTEGECLGTCVARHTPCDHQTPCAHFPSCAKKDELMALKAPRLRCAAQERARRLPDRQQQPPQRVYDVTGPDRGHDLLRLVEHDIHVRVPAGIFAAAGHTWTTTSASCGCVGALLVSILPAQKHIFLRLAKRSRRGP